MPPPLPLTTDHKPVHYKTRPGAVAPTIACGAAPLRIAYYTEEVARVTCFACRKTEVFKADQLGVEPPTPPVTIGEVLADANYDVAVIADRAALEQAAVLPGTHWLKQQRNDRGMYVIEELIHHGDYRSTRRVEVYAINAVTVDAIIQSSAYCYGSWLHPENPDYKRVRNGKLFELVEDLKHGRTNRGVGWSTFRLITSH